MTAMWMVRAGKGSEYIDSFVEKSVVGLGDRQIGQLSFRMSKDEILALYAKHFPDESDGTRTVWANQCFRFLSELKIGDSVVTFDRDQRVYLVGTIASDYEWAPGLLPETPHVRRVKWTHQVSRDALSAEARNTLGGIATLFKPSADAAQEIRAKQIPIGSRPAKEAVPSDAPVAAEDATAEKEIRDDTFERADAFIEDAIDQLDWEDAQDLVEGILRAMGYRTVVSPRGSDRERDIFASPDGLGLQEPRIFVEVKHREGKMGSQEIRAFLGGRKSGDRCLYVSTGGFTREAQYEAERSTIPVTLIDRPYLRKLLVEHYENLDAEARALVPLKRLYWPVR